jgi:L-sorbose 1-phosphate reductase
MEFTIPKTQRAVQLTGPDQLMLNNDKPVDMPGPHQILCRVEASGLCFSDLKLLKQFSKHVRKGPIFSGIDLDILKDLPSYVPDEKPTVPGHETVVRICKVGENITKYKPGERYLVQADYRWVRTATSNAAFGYDLEGGLQEYVLVDERIITSPDGESTLVPATEDLARSAIALAEPWACVEDAYVTPERQKIKDGGRMLIVADVKVDAAVINNLFDKYGKPGTLTWSGKTQVPEGLDMNISTPGSVSELDDAWFDDVIYFGSDPSVVEEIFPKIGLNGLFNIVLCGGSLGREITFFVGRMHYGGIRIVGTTGDNPADSMEYIPETGEIRKGDKINIIGAAGPMGIMHVVRDLCQGVEDIQVYAADVDPERMNALSKIAGPLAKSNNVFYKPYDPRSEKIDVEFDYAALMAPVPALLAQTVKTSGKRALINIFAGIPATVEGTIDLDRYIQQQQYFIGTSGSTLDDMKMVLDKVVSGRLDTNLSVGAVCGLEGAIDGIRAVEDRSIAGKILVYPECKGLGLTPLEKLESVLPEVAAELVNGNWTLQAEKKLLQSYSQS